MYVQARTAFVTEYPKGHEVTVRERDIFAADHIIVKRTPADWWEPMHVRFGGEAEEAVAKKKRPVRAAAKKTEESEASDDAAADD